MHIDPSVIVMSAINFGIIFLILRHFLFDKVNKMLDARQNKIVDQLNNAEKARKKPAG